MPVRETVISKIRRVRKAKQITQADLAAQVGYTESMIQKFEDGTIKPTGFALVKLAKALEIDISVYTLKGIG